MIVCAACPGKGQAALFLEDAAERDANRSFFGGEGAG